LAHPVAAFPKRSHPAKTNPDASRTVSAPNRMKSLLFRIKNSFEGFDVYFCIHFLSFPLDFDINLAQYGMIISNIIYDYRINVNKKPRFISIII
jgi:hypothetical protein